MVRSLDGGKTLSAFIVDGKSITAIHTDDIKEPTRWITDWVVKQDNSGFSYDFCPQEVRQGIRSYAKAGHLLTIVNDCSGGSQAIIEYELDHKDFKKVHFRSYSAAPVRLDRPFVCPTADGYFVGSENLHTSGHVLKIND